MRVKYDSKSVKTRNIQPTENVVAIDMMMSLLFSGSILI